MPDSSIRTLFVDTSSLRHAGFRNPDFQKLLLRSKEGSLRIVVSEIAWHEWRTQMREKACEEARKIRTLFDQLKTNAPSNRILARLPPPALALWEDEDIDIASKMAMAEHATEHGIEIIPFGSDHAERVWRRYFGAKVELPFNPAAKDRENRRKDIPDSWIFEVAVDLTADDRELSALCRDDNLAAALRGIGIKVFDEPKEFVAELERPESPPAEASTQAQPAAPVQPDNNPLAAELDQALAPFKDHDRRVLGYVAYLGTPTKDQLFEMLGRSGIPPEIAKNTTERLVIARLLQDTGHHYLVFDRRLAQTAAAAVESDIIKLLAEASTHGL
jgi:predicted nucleic acid-binding protein